MKTTADTANSAVDAAVAEYLARQAAPKKWRPDATERCSCCAAGQCASHCKSIEHIANLHNVDEPELRSAVWEKRLAKLPKIELPERTKRLFEALNRGEQITSREARDINNDLGELNTLLSKNLFTDLSEEHRIWNLESLSYIGKVSQALGDFHFHTVRPKRLNEQNVD